MSHNTSNIIQVPTEPTNETLEQRLESHAENIEHLYFRRILISELAQLRMEIADEA
jgi:hypothetical protein